MAQQTTFMTSVFMNVVVGELTAVREDTGCQHTDRESELQGDRTELHAQHKAEADHFKEIRDEYTERHLDERFRLNCTEMKNLVVIWSQLYPR